MSEERKERLVEYFDDMCLFLANHHWTKRDERAVAIREMIQKPEVTKEWYDEKARELHEKLYPSLGIDLDFLEMIEAFICSLVKELPVKKPTVPKAFIENMTSRMEQMFMQNNKREDREYFIRCEVLKVAGVEEE